MFKMRTRVGTFVFSSEVVLSHAKLIRDAVVAEVSRGRDSSIKGGYTARKYVKNHCTGSAYDTPFAFVLTK